MIKLSINKGTFYRLQAFTKDGFKSECKVYGDHAVIEVSKEVLSHLLGKMKGEESIDAVIVRGISEYIAPMKQRDNKLQRIRSVYDNKGKTFDRYTVILSDGSSLGLSVNPDSPQGYSQWVDAVEGSHLGERIPLKELPENVREHIERRLQQIDGKD